MRNLSLLRLQLILFKLKLYPFLLAVLDQLVVVINRVSKQLISFVLCDDVPHLVPHKVNHLFVHASVRRLVCLRSTLVDLLLNFLLLNQ